MRTTLNIDDDVLELARSLAEGRRVSIGEALSMLARRGAAAKPATSIRNGLVIFRVPASAAKFGSEEVEAALASEGVDLSSFLPPPRE